MRYPRLLLRLTPLLTAIAVAVGAQAATFSVLALDEDNFFQAPDDLIVDHLITGTGIVSNHAAFNERDVKSTRHNAQTFTIGSAFTLDKIAINYFAAATSEAREATFQLFSVAEPEPGSLSADPVIIDSVSFTSSQLTEAAGTLVFDVIDTEVTAGSSFAIRFVASSSDLLFKWAFADPFADARRYEGNNLVSNNEDYTIGLIGTASTIPEPSAAALLAGGAAVLLATTRRRRR